MKKPIQYRKLTNNLSNLLVCNDQYILINANNYLHLFDGNLKLIRSNHQKKINKNDLKDLSWCLIFNDFLILTKNEIYRMNPLTTKLSLIENVTMKNYREEFISCSCSDDKVYLIKCHLDSNSYDFEEYSLPMFRFVRKFSMFDLIQTSFIIQNGLSNPFNIEEINSIRYFDRKIAILIKINSNWFIYIFHLDEKLRLVIKIPLEEKSRMTILNPINQSIIYKDCPSNSFVQMSMDFENNFQFQSMSEHRNIDYSNGFVDFNGKLRSVAKFGSSKLVFLLDDALVIYKLET